MNAMLAPESIDDLRARKADHRTEAGDLRMELTARGVEARMLVVNAEPFLNRLEMVATEIGPTALASVMGLRALLSRHGRQWDEGPDGSAA